MRVLLAEDDLKLGKLIQYMLEQNQLATEWVKDGEQAYDYASYDEYDVIILDWMMPKMWRYVKNCGPMAIKRLLCF